MTTEDSMPRFLRHVVGTRSFILRALSALPALIKYAAGLSDNESSKEQVFIKFLKGMPRLEFRSKAEEFSLSVLPRMIKEEATARLRWHIDHGHQCILISASIEDYLIPWAKRLGFAAVLATRLEVDAQGNLTGKLLGKNCYGVEKVRRLEKHLSRLADYTIYGYGDSRGDKELLQIADYQFFRSFQHERAYSD